MVSAQEQSTLVVSEEVIDGSPFDLDCYVHSNVPSYVYWYTGTTSSGYEKIYSYHSGTAQGDTEGNSHFEGRDVNANASLEDQVYRLHVVEADKNIDTATYTCERSGELISEEVDVVVQSK